MKDDDAIVMVLAAAGPDGGWSPVTLELLGDATALASGLGGRVGAWVLNEGAGLDALAAHGCQVVWRVRSDRLTGWSSEAVATALARHLPSGCRLVLLGAERAITVRDSPDDRDRFLAERLAPAYEAVGRSLDEVTSSQFEVDMLVAGDLAGMGPTLAGASG